MHATLLLLTAIVADEASHTTKRFGSAGTAAIGSNFQADAAISVDLDRGGTAVGVVIAPGVDGFVVDDVYVGGSLLFSYVTGNAGGVLGYGVGLRFGGNLQLGPSASLVPGLGVGIVGGSAQSLGLFGITVVAAVPLLFHPRPHLFLGFGPAVTIQPLSLVNGNPASKLLTVSLAFTVGGWL